MTDLAEIYAEIKRRKDDRAFSATVVLPGPDPWALFRPLAAQLRREGYRVNGRDETQNTGDEFKPNFVTTTYLTVSWRTLK